ncbi:MAG: DNA repair protein RadC [Candidatus Galacturonibacter soehngenii]|uniref:JAB domain-containing protein n=2 Tax=Candidatus Galacturonatibacter soehngenii TaxID=2307010 RepID=A0A7V7QNL1_9FIRM|nr:JAB domain-containing protein [Candidatus Galacturonibacter soehngenii]MBA4688984.1 DNA repair protein RadC [Candidatus Galacturonibacter soehngenii]
MTRFTMKQIPKQEQPYEKFSQFGPESLSDAELLAIIIRTGTKEEKSIDLAKRILNISSDEGLLAITRLSLKDLQQIKGIGKVKAVQIKCIAEFSRRIAKTTARRRLCMNNPRTIADYYMEDLRFVNQEVTLLVMVDTKNQFLSDKVISKGTVNASLISPREIFLESLNNQAVYIILIHNHPSGDPTPSREDILATKRIKEAGMLIGIMLLDHIIIGDKRYISMKEQGIL